MKPFNLRDLDAVRLLAARGSFRSAARELGVSPSTLSHMIASVEARVGIRLFNRTTRSVAPTQAGLALAERLAPALAGIEDAFDLLDTLRTEPAGRIRLNASETAALRLMPLVAGFMEKHPKVTIELVSDGLLSDIVAGGYDAGIRLEESVPQDMIAVAIGKDERLIVVSAPGYLAGHPPPKEPAELVFQDCIVALLPSGRPMAWEFEEDGTPFTVAVSGRLVVGSTALALEAALRGLGLAYVGAEDAREAIADGRLVQLLAPWTPAFPGLRLYYPRGRHHSAAFRAFLDHVRESLRAE
jgi:DNA-binding transcriptional LysR family regulator